MRHTPKHKILLGSTALTAASGFVRAEGEPSAADIKKALTDLQTTFASFKDANDERVKGVEKKFDDVVSKDKVEKINADLDTLQKSFDDLSAKLARAQLGGGGGDEPSEEVKAYKKAFNTWFRRGGDEQALRDAQVKAAMTTSSDPDAGYLVTPEMDTQITRVLGETTVMRQLATVRTIGTGSYKKPYSLGGATSGWVGETQSRPQTEGVRLAELEFPAMELYAMPAATKTLLDDAAVDIAAWLADEVNITFSEQEGEAFVVGDGDKKPKGLLAYETVANASYAWGKIGYHITGQNGAFATSNPGDKLIDVIYSLKPGYRNNAQWLMNSLTVAAVRKLKDGDGNYLWQPSAQAGQPATLMNYAVADDDNMPVLATNSLSIAFGDFRRAYLIVDRQGVQVLRDPYSSKPYVLFYTTKRVGGGVQNFEAVKFLKFGTS